MLILLTWRPAFTFLGPLHFVAFGPQRSLGGRTRLGSFDGFDFMRTVWRPAILLTAGHFSPAEPSRPLPCRQCAAQSAPLSPSLFLLLGRPVWRPAAKYAAARTRFSGGHLELRATRWQESGGRRGGQTANTLSVGLLLAGRWKWNGRPARTPEALLLRSLFASSLQPISVAN